ncbi:HNH endonuclease signature motif containing protein [Pseudomonas lundensis]|uniref:HNH endonuclease signature motif containing protein n=1 Tax=Pseudomonas lundensis TaxID=86185 RepID=UPI0022B23F35|nr:HNH endonuclease signature motif containing protein [Pseudomonas lundensis]
MSGFIRPLHIHPYKGETTDVVSNGLLLRADLHTLFDLYLIAIEPRSRLIRLSPTLKNSEYSVYEGKPLRSPINAGERPSQALMQWHADQCMWFKSPNGSWG